MATIEGIEGTYRGRRVPLPIGRVDIGRDPSNSMAIADDVLLSRIHASIVFKGKICLCIDHYSTNGTFVDGVRIDPGPQIVPSGAVVKMGSQSFRIDYVQAPEGLIVPKFNVPIAPPIIAEPISVPSSTVGRIGSSPHRKQLDSHADLEPARWYGKGMRTTVQGYELISPMAYVGGRLFGERNGKHEEEPSAICPSYPVLQRGASMPQFSVVGLEYNIEGLVSYGQLSPRQRYEYIRWLSGGRPQYAPEHYLLLFLCGLERRLQEIGNCRERVQIIDEIQNLWNGHSAYPTFRQSASHTLLSKWAQAPDDVKFNIPDPCPWQWNDEGFLWAAACFAHYRRDFTLANAMQWLDSHKEFFAQRIVGQRCWAEFSHLFKIRVTALIGTGIKLSPGTQQASPPGRPINPTIGHIPLTPQVLEAQQSNALLSKLKATATACNDDLFAMAKWIGKNGNGPLYGRAQLVQPEELIRDSKYAKTMVSVLSHHAASGHVVELSSLLNELGLGSEPLNKDELAFFGACASFGFIVEPDARAGVLKGSKIPSVIIAKPQSEGPGTLSPQLSAATRAAVLGQSVVSVSGTTLNSLASVIVRLFELAENEAERLGVFLRWMATRQISISRAFILDLPTQYVPVAAECLIQITQSRSTPESLKELMRILAIWGLKDQDVYARLSSYDEPSVIQRASSPGEFRIPRESSEWTESGGQSTDRTVVDMDKVKALIEETMAASKLLNDVFGEDMLEQAAEPVVSERPNDGIIAVVRSMREGSMDSPEFTSCIAPLNLPIGAAIEKLNEFSIEFCGETLIDGSGPFIIDGYVLRELLDG